MPIPHFQLLICYIITPSKSGRSYGLQLLLHHLSTWFLKCILSTTMSRSANLLDTSVTFCRTGLQQNFFRWQASSYTILSRKIKEQTMSLYSHCVYTMSFYINYYRYTLTIFTYTKPCQKVCIRYSRLTSIPNSHHLIKWSNDSYKLCTATYCFDVIILILQFNFHGILLCHKWIYLIKALVSRKKATLPV